MAPKRNRPQNSQSRKRERPRQEDPGRSNNLTNGNNEIPHDVPPEPTPPNMPAAEHMINMWQQFMEFCQHRSNAENRRDEIHEMEDKTLTRFLRFNPPRFKGEPDDRKAESWIQEIKKIF